MERTFLHVVPQNKKSSNLPYFIAVALLSILIFVRCNDSNGGDKTSEVTYDTLEVGMLYKKPLSLETVADYGLQFVVDSFKIENKKVVPYRDTFYFTRRIDTLKNEDGSYKKDSLGRILVYPPQLQPHPEFLIWEIYRDKYPPYSSSIFPDIWLRRYGTRQDSISLKLIPHPDSLKIK